jgi:hypothetical protein
MTSLFRFSPLNMVLIGVVLALVLVLLALGLRGPQRARKLARFAFLVILGLVVLTAVVAVLRIYVFPLPPF